MMYRTILAFLAAVGGSYVCVAHDACENGECPIDLGDGNSLLQTKNSEALSDKAWGDEYWWQATKKKFRGGSRELNCKQEGDDYVSFNYYYGQCVDAFLDYNLEDIIDTEKKDGWQDYYYFTNKVFAWSTDHAKALAKRGLHFEFPEYAGTFQMGDDDY